MKQLTAVLLLIICMVASGQQINYNYLPVKVNGKYGFVDTAGKYLIRPDYDFLGCLVEGRARVNVGGKPDDHGFMEGGFWTFMDSLEQPVSVPVYEAVSDFCEGRARVMKHGLYGFIDKNGLEVIPCQYPNITDFHNGMAQFEKDGLWGSIDTDGNMVISPRFDKVYYFNEDRAVVGHPFYKAYINKLGNFITDSIFFEAKSFENGLAIVVSGDSVRYGMLDAFGAKVIPCIYGYITRFSEGMAAVNLNGVFVAEKNEVTGGHWGFIDKGNRLVIPADYDNAGAFSENLCPVKKNEKWGYIDKDNKLRISFKYQMAYLFSCDRARIVKKSTTGFIDNSGTVIIKPGFEEAEDFSSGLAIVRQGSAGNKKNRQPGQTGKYGIINKAGEFVLYPEFDAITRFGNKTFRVYKGSGWGYYNTKGECVFSISE
ncbi:MAG TPA: WG repeat-containing protein [Bacteroidales bacterium]|nr:WG repeat-containing protein [Bacteroidales bacterium]HPB25475.1 WG repeat-containing protein [Bacteroidales bacterium]HPI29604.1 WG repeat-containing protein [Bacteroidales bacterium]HQN16189.1 WG repeat-containing protein [Bacteroidales bacterium]HQP14724.1 WG repeat-containing protein [Bacteroidales bacterium]